MSLPRWRVRFGSREFIVYAATEELASERVQCEFPEFPSHLAKAELAPSASDPYEIEYGPGWFKGKAA